MATYEKFNNEKYNIIYKTDKSKMHEWEAYVKTTMNDATTGIKLKAQLLLLELARIEKTDAKQYKKIMDAYYLLIKDLCELAE
jgi:hypothetical protein